MEFQRTKNRGIINKGVDVRRLPLCTSTGSDLGRRESSMLLGGAGHGKDDPQLNVIASSKKKTNPESLERDLVMDGSPLHYQREQGDTLPSTSHLHSKLP